MIISPPSTITDLIADVSYSESSVWCRLRERNEELRRTARQLGLEWDYDWHAWRRSLRPELNGQPCDRAAELAAALIDAGIACKLSDPVAELVRTGNWKPEIKRWIRVGKKVFRLRWRGKNENLYVLARTLPESAYDPDSKSVTVPMLYYQEVIGFAEEHEFKFDKEAQALVETARREYERLILPAVPPPAPLVRKKSKPLYCDPARYADLPPRNISIITELYPHQVAAVEKLLPLRLGALFMDMGTGKTRCAIELVARRQSRVSKVIWFTPVSLKLTIAAEIAKHTTGEDIYLFDDSTSAGDIRPAFWYVVGIESMSSSDRVVLAVKSLMDADTFVIVDESSYIKGHASLRSMRITEIGRHARYRMLLTGTPVSQGVVDLYAQMRFLSPDILGYGSFYSFARNHLEYSEKYRGMIVRSLGLQTLAEKIEPFIYQVTKDECLDLPEKLYDAVYFGLTGEQWKAYNQAKVDILSAILERAVPDYIIFQLFTALQQIVSGYWKREDELLEFPHRRIEALATVIEGIPENEKVIIWCKFVYSVKGITAALPDAALYYGDLNESQRAEQLERFRGDGCRFLIATQATGGHGLTLNEARYHVFYENEFKYSHRIQAEDRSHRIGQTRPVTYIDIVANAGIDRRIQDALSKKQDVVKTFKREVDKLKGLKEL